MVQVAGVGRAFQVLKASVRRTLVLGVAALLFLFFTYSACTAKVHPNEFGVEQRKFALKTGIMPEAYGPGLYFVGPGTTMRTFPLEIHVLDASYDRARALAQASSGSRRRVQAYFDRRA